MPVPVAEPGQAVQSAEQLPGAAQRDVVALLALAVATTQVARAVPIAREAQLVQVLIAAARPALALVGEGLAQSEQQALEHSALMAQVLPTWPEVPLVMAAEGPVDGLHLLAL